MQVDQGRWMILGRHVESSILDCVWTQPHYTIHGWSFVPDFDTSHYPTRLEQARDWEVHRT